MGVRCEFWYRCSGDSVLSCSGVEDFSVVHFGFQVSEEVLHDRIVVAVGFTRHRLDTAVVTDQVTPGGMLVLESLIGVHHPPRLRRTGRNRLSQ